MIIFNLMRMLLYYIVYCYSMDISILLFYGYLYIDIIWLLYSYIYWGLGIGDWGLGIGPNPQSPIPNPQSPVSYFINNPKIQYFNLYVYYNPILNNP